MADSDNDKQVVHVHYVHHIYHYPGMQNFPGSYPPMPGQPHTDVMGPGFYAPTQPKKKPE